LQMLVDAGRFVRERTEVFTFLYHFDTVDVWLAYMSENWSSAHVSVEVIARAQQAFLAETGELRIVRSIEATRLRRT
jgi:hypothetical protein